jgi:predicted phage terminase large subunit-like protein
VSEVQKLGREEFNSFLANLNVDQLTRDQQRDLLATITRIRELEQIELARTDFLTFVRLTNPLVAHFSSKGQHHKLANAFERIADGRLKRLTISMPPRWGKSELGSICLPAWFMGRFPDKKIIQASANTGNAKVFGRKVKAIMESDIYKQIFPGVTLSKDSKGSGAFATNQGGEYFALGIDSGVAGKGAHLLICDDIVNEQDAKTGNPKAFDAAWTWFQTGPLQRLQPGGAIVMIATRWSKADPIGKVQRAMRLDSNADKYESIEFAALDGNGESNFPEYWPTKDLLEKKNNMLPVFWNAQYMQNPTAAENSIVPRIWWRPWEQMNQDGDYVTPECFFTLMVLDTAQSIKKRANPTACTVWGVFRFDDPTKEREENHIILLYTYKKKLEFGNLKIKVKELIKEWEPDAVLIEAKSSGPALRSELAEAGIYTEGVVPKPGEDKATRIYSISDVVSSGYCHYVPTLENEEAIQELADFPGAENDDVADTMAYAIRHIRAGRLVATANDKPYEEDEDAEVIDRAYY